MNLRFWQPRCPLCLGALVPLPDAPRAASVCSRLRRRETCPACTSQSRVEATRGGLPVICLTAYEGRVAELIKRLKYGEETALARPLGIALALACLSKLEHGSFAEGPRGAATHSSGAFFKAEGPAGGPPGKLPIGTGPWGTQGQLRVVPIPLHPRRLAERGYNQTALLGRAFAKTCGARVDFETLMRPVWTTPQARLDEKDRRKNVREAFSARSTEGASPTDICWLLDDVMTTGSTLDAAAHALRKAGWQVPGAVCIARKL